MPCSSGGVPLSIPPAWCPGVKSPKSSNFSMEKEGRKPSEPRTRPQAADAVGEILLSLSYLPTAERLTVVVVKAKNLIWANDKTTAGKALLAAWLLLYVAGGSYTLAAKSWAPGGISRCRAQCQAHHPWPRLGSGALHGGKINLAEETWDPWRGTGSPWGRDVTLRAGGWGTGCETTVGNPRG